MLLAFHPCDLSIIVSIFGHPVGISIYRHSRELSHRSVLGEVYWVRCVCFYSVFVVFLIVPL